MRLLLDESLPRRLGQELHGHEVVTVPDMGWAGKANGELLTLARGQFEAFLTADQGLEFQVNLAEADVPIIVLAATTNRFDDLKLLVPQILSALENVESGEAVRVAV